MAEFKLGRLKFVWKGDWTTATAYVKDDIVNYNGTGWVCISGHTSTASFPDDRDDSNWQVITSGLNFRGEWNSLNTYEKNDIVQYTGTTWIAVVDSVQGTVPSPSVTTPWDLFLQGDADSVLTTEGDISYRGASAAERLAIGVDGAILQSDGDVPVWSRTINNADDVKLTGQLYGGTGAPAAETSLALTDIQALFKSDVDAFAQFAIHNASDGGDASTDFIAYADNGDNDSGWIDMGITSSAFTAAAFGLTTANDGYIFLSAPATTTGKGNLVIATSENGSENDIVFATGGFATGQEKMRLVGTPHGMYNAGLNLMDDVSTTSGNFYVGPNAKALTVDNVGSGYVGLTNATAIFTGDTNNFVQFALKNENSGTSASTDIIAYSSNGDNDSGWIDMGITSENYADPAFTVTGPDTGYIFMSAKSGTTGSGNLLIGTDETGTNNDIVFFTNGFDAGNERLRIVGTGVNAGVQVYADTESTSTTTGALRVEGGIGLQGNLYVGGDVNIVGNITLGGSGNTVETESLAVADPIIRMANGNTTSDALDIGFVGTYGSSGAKYTGLVRDASDNTYKLFTGMTANPTTTVDFTGATYADLKAGSLDLTATTTSNSTTSGALKVAGGLGVAGDVYAGSLNTTGDLAVNGGDITTTATGTATVFNTNATTVNIGGAATAVAIGASTGTTTINHALTVTKQTTLAQITEVLNTKTGATGTVTHDYSTGDIWFHSSIAANFTVNLTNVPTTNDRAISIVLVLNQGASGYIPNAFQIDGASQTLRWASNTTPTASTSKIDIVTFTLFRTGSTWYVVGQLTAFA